VPITPFGKRPRALAAAALLGAALLSGTARAADDMPSEHFRAVEAFQHSDFKGALPRFEVLLASFAARGDDERAGLEAEWAGLTRRILGEPEKALALELDSIARLRRAGDKVTEADAQREAFLSLRALKRDDEARAHLDEVLRLDAETESDRTLWTDLRSLGGFQAERGDWAGALATADRRIRLAARTSGKSGEGEARLERAAALRGLGRDGEAGREDARGLALQTEARRDAAAAHAEPEVDLLRARAIAFQDRYDQVHAVAAWRAMLAEARRRKFKNGMTSALLNLGVADENAGDHRAAIAEFEEGARVAHEDGGVNETGLTIELAISQANAGDLTAALATLRRARGLAALGRDAKGELDVIRVTRMVYGLRGDYPKMIACNRQMLAVARRSGKKTAEFEAEKAIGQFDGDIGDAAAGLEHFTRMLALARDLGDREKIADALNEVGLARMNLGEDDEAERAMRASLAIHDWPGGHVNLGEIDLSAGRPEPAYAELRPLSDHHIDLGDYYLLKKEYSRARALYSRLLDEKGSERDVPFLLAAHTGLGLAEEGLRDDAAAAENYAASEALIDGLRDRLSLENRLHFLGASDWMMPHLEPFEGMVRVSARLSGGARESLHHAEFTRGRLFAEATARRAGSDGASLPAARAEAERKVQSEVSALASETEADARAGREAAARDARTRLTAAEKRRDLFVEELRKDFPAYAAVRYPRPLYAEEYALEPGEVVVEYEVTAPYTKAFVVKDGKVAFSWDIGLTRPELTALVKKYRGSFEGVADAAQLAAYDPRLGLKLYRLLLAPAAEAKGADGKPLIGPDAKLTIIPDEILGVLPFESLVVSAPERRQMPAGRHGPAPVGVRYAADLFDIAYEHSGTAMTVSRRLAPAHAPTGGLFVLADPVFNPADPRLRGTAAAVAALPSQTLKTMGAVATTMGLGGARRGLKNDKEVGRDDFLFPRLDKTGVLASDLRDKVFAGAPTRVLVGTEASKEALAGVDLSRYRYLVFATHGLLDDEIPGLKEPALVLNQLGPGAGDGFLTMSEIMGLRLDAEVVALTACQTGLGRQLTGEGVMGLGRAFQYAGARSVLVSLWSVAEDSTSLLAERFFAHLKEGKTRRQALRLARADVRRAGYEHPFYWAPFILIGG
jgi:tetratricopeptide (TPR) repeat protein